MDFNIDPDLAWVLKALTAQKCALDDENRDLRRKLSKSECDSRMMVFWRRRAKHLTKLIAKQDALNAPGKGRR